MAASQITLDQTQQLRAELQDHAAVPSPGSEQYERSLKRWSAIGYQRPGVVVHPTDVQGIARTVRFAKNHHLDLAVKGGGHSTDTSSSSDGGILVDLGSMNRVRVDPVAQTVAAQGGALWADVNQVAAQYKLAVVGGTVSQTGTGGLTLRGGYGYLTPQYGLVIDNLLSANTITGEGTVLKASTKDNADLFWALRGAGPNVGVVEEFVFQAHPQPNLVWNGMRSYPCSQLSKVIEALNAALLHPQGKAAAQCVLSLSPDNGAPIVSTILFFNGSEEEGRRHFSQLLELQCIAEDVKMRPYSEANTMLDALMPPGGRKKIIGIQLAPPVQPGFASEIMDQISHKLTNQPDMAKSSLEIDYFDPSQICRTPITGTAFPARSNLLNGALILQWTDSTKDEDFISWGKSIQSMCEDELRRTGHTSNNTVSNFISYTQDDKATVADMFGVNADRLSEIKAEYDPANIFNKLNPV